MVGQCHTNTKPHTKMSALVHIKSIVVEAIEDSRKKAAVMQLINAVDNDLDEQGYNASEDVYEAITNLDNVIAEIETENSEIVEPSSKDDDDEGEGSVFEGLGEDDREV